MYVGKVGTLPAQTSFFGFVTAKSFWLDVLNVIRSTPELMHIPIVVARGEFCSVHRIVLRVLE